MCGECLSEENRDLHWETNPLCVFPGDANPQWQDLMGGHCAPTLGLCSALPGPFPDPDSCFHRMSLPLQALVTTYCSNLKRLNFILQSFTATQYGLLLKIHLRQMDLCYNHESEPTSVSAAYRKAKPLCKVERVGWWRLVLEAGLECEQLWRRCIKVVVEALDSVEGVKVHICCYTYTLLCVDNELLFSCYSENCPAVEQFRLF